MTEAARQSATLWNINDRRGFSWANGEYRCTLYNHYWTPNTQEVDCVLDLLVVPPGLPLPAALSGNPIKVTYSVYGCARREAIIPAA